MTLLIFFAIVFATIVLAIVLQRIIHCPILVGFAFFAIFLVVAAILDGTTLVIIAIILGIIAFLAAFLDCIFSRSRFFRNNRCLTCNSDDDDDENLNRRRRRCNCNCNNQEDVLRIVNSNGEVIARINGNQISCLGNNNNNNNNNGCGCGNNATIVASLNEGNNINTISANNTLNSSCGCSNRSYRRM